MMTPEQEAYEDALQLVSKFYNDAMFPGTDSDEYRAAVIVALLEGTYDHWDMSHPVDDDGKKIPLSHRELLKERPDLMKVGIVYDSLNALAKDVYGVKFFNTLSSDDRLCILNEIFAVPEGYAGGPLPGTKMGYVKTIHHIGKLYDIDIYDPLLDKEHGNVVKEYTEGLRRNKMARPHLRLYSAAKVFNKDSTPARSFEVKGYGPCHFSWTDLRAGDIRESIYKDSQARAMSGKGGYYPWYLRAKEYELRYKECNEAFKRKRPFPKYVMRPIAFMFDGMGRVIGNRAFFSVEAKEYDRVRYSFDDDGNEWATKGFGLDIPDFEYAISEIIDKPRSNKAMIDCCEHVKSCAGCGKEMRMDSSYGFVAWFRHSSPDKDVVFCSEPCLYQRKHYFTDYGLPLKDSKFGLGAYKEGDSATTDIWKRYLIESNELMKSLGLDKPAKGFKPNKKLSTRGGDHREKRRLKNK